MIFCSLQLGALSDHTNIKLALKVLYIEQLGLPAKSSEFANELFTTIKKDGTKQHHPKLNLWQKLIEKCFFSVLCTKPLYFLYELQL